MATVETNLDDHHALLDALADTINFERAGADRDLAESLVKLTVTGIASRALNAQTDYDGNPWADNAPGYKRAKGYLPVGVGPTGAESAMVNRRIKARSKARSAAGRKATRDNADKMLSEAQLTGVVTISAHLIEICYGTSDIARKKLQWFSNGSADENPNPVGESSGATHQPPRLLWGFDSDIRTACQARAEEFVQEYILSL